MVDVRLILKKVNVLSDAFRRHSKSSIADRIDEIVDDRIIWDKMVLKLASELESILTNEQISEPARIMVEELLAELGQKRLKAFSDAVYGPASALAADLGALGFTDWQLKIEEAISTGSTSTEIFMALRWHLDELLRVEQTLPKELRERIAHIRNSLNQALKIP